MARQDVTVNLPIGDPDGTIELVGRIIDRNTAMGANSPINNDFSFAEIANGLSTIKALRKEADKADRKSLTLHGNAMRLLGLAQAQNKKSDGTIYTETLRIRDILMVKFRENPEELELWGFNVVVDQTEGKRTVRIEIPVGSPADFITLAEAIVEKNTAEGINSPLSSKIDMVAYATNTTQAGIDYKQAKIESDLKESKHGEALNMLGYAPGQSSETVGTAYYLICSIRDLLLAVYSNNPEALSEWGFDVVVRVSKNPPR